MRLKDHLSNSHLSVIDEDGKSHPLPIHDFGPIVDPQLIVSFPFLEVRDNNCVIGWSNREEDINQIMGQLFTYFGHRITNISNNYHPEADQGIYKFEILLEDRCQE